MAVGHVWPCCAGLLCSMCWVCTLRLVVMWGVHAYLCRLAVQYVGGARLLVLCERVPLDVPKPRVLLQLPLAQGPAAQALVGLQLQQAVQQVAHRGGEVGWEDQGPACVCGVCVCVCVCACGGVGSHESWLA